MKDEELKPKDHAEAIAVFRAQVIGPLACRADWSHGELADALRELAAQPVRPPGSDHTRCYAVSTLERWLYRWRQGGIKALTPRRRSDRGHARALNEEQRQLLLAIRREHPWVPSSVILRTLELDGRIPRGAVSEATVRRFFVEHGLDRATLRRREGRDRRRWEASRPHQLWHADVMHGPPIVTSDGRTVPLRVHAILDDRTRYVVAIQACATERESEMLALLVKAIRWHGLPETLYLDNGPTYVGDALRTACARLGISLVHAKPHDPQARGKMERFWRTLREQCVSLMGPMSSLHDVQVRLLAWLDRHYHVAPHSSLLGRTPSQVLDEECREHERDPVNESMLREALTVRATRRVRGDGTLDVAGRPFELREGFMAGHIVTVARSILDPTEPPWVEHEDKRLPLLPVDPAANAMRKRTSKPAKRGIDAIPFDPPSTLLRALLAPKGGCR